MSRARDLSNFLVQDSRLSNVDSDYIQLRQATADLSNLNASNLTSGTIPNARISSGSVTQHVDLSNLNASNLTSGSIPNARVASGAVTQHVSAVNVNVGSWSPSPVNFTATFYNHDYVRVGRLVHVTAYYKITGYTNTSNKAYMSGLPFTSSSSGDPQGTGYVNGAELHNFSYGCFVHSNSTAVYFRGGDGRKSLGSADYKGTLRGSDFQYMSTGYRGNDEAFHNFTLTYISAS